jgi:hypothetical protein
MLLTQKELSHLIFLSDVVLNGKKKALMEETLQCLAFLVKSIEQVDIPDLVMERVQELVANIESQLRSENDRMQDIGRYLAQPGLRKPFG